MEDRKKKAQVWLGIGVALMLVSMIGASAIMSSGGKVRIEKLSFETTSGYRMSALLFIPAGVSAKNKAPAIITSHGMLNNKEMQDLNFVELARRGFVVLAGDLLTHGNSESVNSIGPMYAGVTEQVKMLSSLAFVDTKRIGITGHSFGGANCNAAAAADALSPNPVIRAVLINSCDATYKDPATKAFANVYGDKDVGIIADQYDEFMMRDVDASGKTTAVRDYIKYGNAQSFLHFGEDPAGKDLRSAETVYKETIKGREAVRIIYNPAQTHPWSHFSSTSTKATIEFFTASLGAPRPIAATNQVWQWKVLFNFLGLVGFAIFAVQLAILLVFTAFFSSLRAPQIVAPHPMAKGGTAWFWASLLVGALFSAISYLPILTAVKGFTVGVAPTVQSATWGVSLWAAANGLFTLLLLFLGYRFVGKKSGLDLGDLGVKIGLKDLGKTILLGLIVASATFAWVFFADYFFSVDFRIWVVAAKWFGPDKAIIALFPFVELFAVYFVLNSVAINCFNYHSLGGRQWLNTAVLALFNLLGPLALVVMQYITLFKTGFNLWQANQAHLFIVWLFPILVLLPATAVMSRKIYKVTNNPYLPGIINAALVTLMSVANTVTFVK